MLASVLGWAKNLLQPGAAILMYHRVAEPPQDPYQLCVSPQHFAEHMEVLARETQVMGLLALNRAVRDGAVPRRAAAVTFDDGYADALLEAKPRLEQYEVPATVFVTTGFVGTDRELFWDELERLLLHPGTLPNVLELEVLGTTHRFELGEAAAYGEDAYRHHRLWNMEMRHDPTPRHAACRKLNALMRPLPDGERTRVLAALRTWAGTAAAARPSHRLMSADEIRRLSAGGLVEIGAHTETHPVLAAHPVALQRAEITASKRALEEILEHPVTSFAYPFGYHHDYTAETVSAVREAGFACACSNFRGLLRSRTTDCFELPRFMVFDWDGDAFARHLSEWFRG